MEQAALYLRLSKEDLEKEKGTEVHSRSIENQKKLLEEYAKVHHLAVYKYYIDDDYSGLSLTRPAFSRMLEAAKGHQFTVILAKSQSRLSRNMEHAEYLLHELLPELGIRFVGVVDGVDTAQKSGKKARQINALVNEWYSEDLSENIRAVYQRKMQNGEYLGAYAPYGYRKGEQDSHILEIEEETACWVRSIYTWYLAGWSAAQICRELDCKKVPTPSDRIHRKNGEQAVSHGWSISTIKKILANEVYIGSVVQGKSRRRSFKDKRIEAIPRQEWVVVPQQHAAIIEPQQFEQVKELRRHRCKCQKGNID